ncbi:MAG: hypothetical protein DMD40_10245 [Gemmatimonadetes bacterium]|nr:MAG: hypothetical protein DMD40_10245 [Gemmatimonadota bacterium]
MTRAFLRCSTIAVAASGLAPTVITVASLLHRRQSVPLGSTAVTVAVVLGATWLFHLLLRRFAPALDANARDQAAFLDALPLPYLDLAIAGAAGLSLFLELAVIRWQGTVFEFFSFYKNFGLLACFAGLGLGYALATRDRICLALVVPLLAWQFGVLIGLRFGLEPWQLESVTAIPFLEQLSMGARTARTLAQWFAVYFFLCLVFLLTALAFVPVGQLCGRLMTRRPRLRAYGLNLLGSLAGVLLTLLAGALWTSPVVWYGVAFLALLLFVVPRPATLLAGFAAAITAVVILAWPVQQSWQRIYSPYQLLELGYSDAGLMVIRAAGHYYQRVHDLSSPRAADDPRRRQVRDYYDLPYRVLPAPADVAVVGAGAGNDVAAALRGGAAHIDAIEIDPAILWAGRANHPERPYTNARVLPIANDARSYLRTTDRTYNLIVYGLLDSHTLLSHASSVRLDSFVYTVEGFREARARLKPGGLLVVSFSALTDAIGRKMYEMLRHAFDGAAPAVVSAGYDGAVVFLQNNEGTFALPPETLAETRRIHAGRNEGHHGAGADVRQYLAGDRLRDRRRADHGLPRECRRASVRPATTARGLRAAAREPRRGLVRRACGRLPAHPRRPHRQRGASHITTVFLGDRVLHAAGSAGVRHRRHGGEPARRHGGWAARVQLHVLRIPIPLPARDSALRHCVGTHAREPARAER